MRRGGGGNSGNNGGGRRGGSPRSQNFESNGPDVKVRGNAQQVVDKYQALAREAATAGNPVMAENYYQHAEHYYRVMTASGGGENRHMNRQPDIDDTRGYRGVGYNPHQGNRQSNSQSNGQPAEQFVEGEAQTGFVRVSDDSAPSVGAADAATVGDGTRAPEVAQTSPGNGAAAEASPDEPDAEKVKKSDRKRRSRAPKPVRDADESMAAVPSDAAPVADIAQPATEGSE